MKQRLLVFKAHWTRLLILFQVFDDHRIQWLWLGSSNTMLWLSHMVALFLYCFYVALKVVSVIWLTVQCSISRWSVIRDVRWFEKTNSSCIVWKGLVFFIGAFFCWRCDCYNTNLPLSERTVFRCIRCVCRNSFVDERRQRLWNEFINLCFTLGAIH